MRSIHHLIINVGPSPSFLKHTIRLYCDFLGCLVCTMAHRQQTQPAAAHAPEPGNVPMPPWRVGGIPPWRVRRGVNSQHQFEVQLPARVDEDDEAKSVKSEDFSPLGIWGTDAEPEIQPEIQPDPPTCISIFVETLGRSVDEPDIFDNVLKRIRDRGAVTSMCIDAEGLELFVRMGTAAQLNRVHERIESVLILQSRIRLRLGHLH